MLKNTIRKFLVLLALVFTSGLLLAACGDDTNNTTNTTTRNPVTTTSLVTTTASTTPKAANNPTAQPTAKAATTTAAATQSASTSTKVDYEKILEATIKAKSYRSVATVVGKDTTITTKYVAPDRISTILTFSSTKSYIIYIGDVTYRSTDGTKWKKSTSKGSSIPDLFQSQKLPPETKYTSLPDETLNGKAVGVFSYEVTNSSDPLYAGVPSIKATVWYDKQNLWILKQSGKSDAGDTEVIYSDYNSPANKIEAPN